MSGISLGMGFTLPAQQPIDERLVFNTKEIMKNYPTEQLPDVYFCVNKEDGLMYVFNKNNIEDSITGKWKKIDTRDDLIFTNCVVFIADWTLDTAYSTLGYLYKADIACTGALSTMTPNVVFSCTDAVSSNFAPICESGTDTVTIYCKAIPSADITIPEIRLMKGSV